MAKRKKTRKPQGGAPSAAKPGTVAKQQAAAPWFRVRRLGEAFEALLHPQATEERPWRHVPLVLALAFAARAAVALSGDFVLHPDEIMQYLEPAHRLVFGSGVTYWEYFYGARAWLVPGLVAGVLKLFDLVGLGEPRWYVAGVKLVFCALSLAIPLGMYVFARRHFSEYAARAALLAGAFWYELVGFAHKPMTEFVATGALVALLAVVARPAASDRKSVWPAASLAVLTGALRFQYAPLALVLLGIAFWCTGKKKQLALAAAVLALAVGVFDGVTWDAGVFHSYLTNLRFNLAAGVLRGGESPAWQYLAWFLIAGAGLAVLCAAGAAVRPRRYGFLLALIVLVLVLHALQSHKEYRFAFVVVPLWLLIGADLMGRIAQRPAATRWMMGALAAVFTVVSLGGILNALPYQDRLYKAWSRETGVVAFLRNQDAVFAAYRYLAQAPGVGAVWHADRFYYNLPGYYYLHHEVPFYDVLTGALMRQDLATISASVSHVVSANLDLAIPGYTVERTFGDIRILRRDGGERLLRRWQGYTPTVVSDTQAQIMRQMNPAFPWAPANWGIRFAEGGAPEQRQKGGQP